MDQGRQAGGEDDAAQLPSVPNRTRLWLSVIAYNLGNLWRRLALPRRIGNRLANQDRKQTSARKPSSGEVSAARQTGAGKTSTAAPQNGQNEPHYHPKGASQRDLRLTRRGRRARL